MLILPLKGWIRSLLWCFGVGWFAVWGFSPLLAAEPSTQQVALMQEEYQGLAKLRHKFKELLERQQFQETLHEGDDLYTSFENLEQWLEKIQANPQGADAQKLQELLKEFETHVGEILKAQEELAQQLPPPEGSPPPAMPTIPVQALTQTLQQLLATGKFEEARDLLAQMLANVTQQQQRLRQSVSQHYQKKYSKLSQQLEQLNKDAETALAQQRAMREALAPHLSANQFPSKTQENLKAKQQEITKNIEKMQQAAQALDRSPLVPTEGLEGILQQAHSTSQETESSLKDGQPLPSDATAQASQVRLEQLQNELSAMQQQVEQLSQPQQSSSRPQGQRHFFSEKGVNPFKGEQDFQVSPAYREQIQRLNQSKHQKVTPTQQEYLQKVIK